MAEWFKAHAWKACKGATLSRVQIPLSPPNSLKNIFKNLLHFFEGYKGYYIQSFLQYYFSQTYEFLKSQIGLKLFCLKNSKRHPVVI
jgi:DNA phosphorothioation-dependent restriction protein DptG